MSASVHLGSVRDQAMIAWDHDVDLAISTLPIAMLTAYGVWVPKDSVMLSRNMEASIASVLPIH